MKTIGYHTLEDRDNVDYIEQFGPIKCNTNAAWLGHGYYFWDANIEWAHKFGKSRYNYDYFIFEAEIAITDETYDLFGNVTHKLEFKEAWKLLKESGYIETVEDIRVADVLEYLKRLSRFKYNSIRAADNPDHQNIIYFGGQKGEYMFLNERLQICLLNKSNLSLSSFRVVYPEYLLNCYMNTPLLQELKQHLANISKEEFQKEWSEIKSLEFGGPTIEEFLQTISKNIIISGIGEIAVVDNLFVSSIIIQSAGESNYSFAA